MPVRFAMVGGSLAGAIGAIVGIVIGLNAYAPTAPFAAVELGIPASVAGGIVGLIAGAIMTATRRIRRQGTATP